MATLSPHTPSEQTMAERLVPAATLGEMVIAAGERHEGPALRSKRGGVWGDTGYAEVLTTARAIARGLIASGIVPGDRVSILSGTREEWTLCDLGALLAGATVVPVYYTNSPEECQYVLEHAGARIVFCEDAGQVEKVLRVRDQCPALETIVVIDADEPIDGTISLDDLRGRGASVAAEAVEAAVARVTPDDVATIVYTSGTTGPPKGCLITHGNFMASIGMAAQQLPIDDEGVVFMFLPLAHVFARIVQMFTLDVGGTLAYWQGDPKKAVEDIAEIRPTHLPSVPRVFEKIHTKALASAEEGGALKRRLFDAAVRNGRAMRAAEASGERPGAVLRARHAVLDRLVLSKVRALFGGRLEFAVTGAAPIAAEVLEFFHACGVLILEGYGMTETCSIATLNTQSEYRFGTVGREVPGTGVKIADDGEVLLRGPNVFGGYYKNEAATAETFQGEWLLSGDLGSLDDGYLTITGRKKDLIITSSGKNISPSNIESALRESRWISQAVVYGDEHSYLVALLALDPEEAQALAGHLGVTPDVPTMADEPKVLEALQAEVDEANARFARIEQIKRFGVLDRELTQEEGELTPTLKIKRNVVYDRFRDRFEALYDG